MDRAAAIFAILSAIMIFGWIINFFEVVTSGFDISSPVMILRVIGVFVAPLGAIMGFI